MRAAGLLISIGEKYCPIACPSPIERRQPHPSGSGSRCHRRDTSRDGLDRVDPRPANTVDGFDPLIVSPRSA